MLQPEAGEMRGHCAGHPTDEVDSAIGQMDQRKIGEHLAQDVNVQARGMGGYGVARVNGRKHLG